MVAVQRCCDPVLGTQAPVVVRLPFILLFVLSQFLMWRIGCLISGRRAALWAVIALNLSPVFGVTTATWVLPDGPLDAALLAAVLCLLHALSAGEALTSQPSRHDLAPRQSWRALAWWVAAGLCAGLALFSKYSAALTVLGLLLFLADRPDPPVVWLARPEPYLAAAAALAAFSPGAALERHARLGVVCVPG